MSVLVEVIAQFVFEVLIYGAGKVVAMVFLPHLSIEPIEKQKQAPWYKFVPFTYTKNNRRFLHTESLQFIGLMCWVVIGVWTFIVFKYAT